MNDAMRGARRWLGRIGLVLAFAGGLLAAERPFALKVGGFGWLKNRELEQAVELLLGDGAVKTRVDAGFIEDAALVLNSELAEAGYFAARVRAEWIGSDGRAGSAVIDAGLSRPLPRPLEARALRLTALPGTRAVVTEVTLEGLASLDEADGRAFFQADTGLFTPDRLRAYAPARARRAADQLREALRARGRAEAAVEVAVVGPDPASGAVRLHVTVREGPLWRVTGWRAEGVAGAEVPGGVPEGVVGAVWTRSLAQDAAQAVRLRYHALGHAEARVDWTAEPGAFESGAAERPVVAVARIAPGPAWTVGEVKFEGVVRTRPGLLAERARLAPGSPFDPEAVEAARLRFAGLGVFSRLEALEEDPAEATDGERDVVFRVREEAPWQAAWTLGYGSYEQVRGALELTRGNLHGRAHRDRVEVAQSVRATRGEYRYTVPTLFDDTVEASARAYGLRREEPSFLRVEYGAGLEASRDVPWIEARGTAGLVYEVLRANEVTLARSAEEAARTAVSAFNLGLVQDRRDNPIRPRRGHRWSVRSETALPALGGEADYERLELAGARHWDFAGERWLHAGVSSGLLAGGGGEVPVNKLFFPGGESSIRGYPEGEAAPRDVAGRFVGARGYWLANLEFEQLVTGRWTAVVFADVLGTAREPADWPGDDILASVGPGLRYQSPIGPIRLEYGRNLNPRAGDPKGTLHFSIGFPF